MTGFTVLIRERLKAKSASVYLRESRYEVEDSPRPVGDFLLLKTW